MDREYVIRRLSLVHSDEKAAVNGRRETAGHYQCLGVASFYCRICELYEHFGIKVATLAHRDLGVAGAEHVGKRNIHLVFAELPRSHGRENPATRASINRANARYTISRLWKSPNGGWRTTTSGSRPACSARSEAFLPLPPDRGGSPKGTGGGCIG